MERANKVSVLRFKWVLLRLGGSLAGKRSVGGVGSGVNSGRRVPARCSRIQRKFGSLNRSIERCRERCMD